MSQLCYTLEEAARRLNLSETVLVRLSQTFRVPAAAYETVGYLSFKGDLAFSDEDIRFFGQVKERLLAGESLDEVKSRIRPSRANNSAQAAEAAATGTFEDSLRNVPLDTVPGKLAEPAPRARTATASSDPLRDRPPAPTPVVPLRGEALRGMPDRSPLTRAAEESFERYKRKQGTGLGRVFEKMMREVTPPTAKRHASRPGPKPLRPKVAIPEGEIPFRETQPPFEPRRVSLDTPSEKRNAFGWWTRKPPTPATPVETAWEEIIQHAVHQPRTLDTHLKTAATLLRDRATHPTDTRPDTHSR